MWPFSKKLEDVLNKTKTVRIHGVVFKIKKIDPTAYLDGSKVMLQAYDTYKVSKQSTELNESTLLKVKEHYRDVFLASVVYPKLRRKEGEGLLVDHLFTEWDLAHELYAKIMELTYGKKKMKLNT
jgi:hypothetical protein